MTRSERQNGHETEFLCYIFSFLSILKIVIEITSAFVWRAYIAVETFAEPSDSGILLTPENDKQIDNVIYGVSVIMTEYNLTRTLWKAKQEIIIVE